MSRSGPSVQTDRGEEGYVDRPADPG